MQYHDSYTDKQYSSKLRSLAKHLNSELCQFLDANRLSVEISKFNAHLRKQFSNGDLNPNDASDLTIGCMERSDMQYHARIYRQALRVQHYDHELIHVTLLDEQIKRHNITVIEDMQQEGISDDRFKTLGKCFVTMSRK